MVPSASGHKAVEGVDPAVRLAANGALSQGTNLRFWRRSDRYHRLMRHGHVILALTVDALPPTVVLTSRLPCLIALARRVNLLAAPTLSALLTAVALASVATGADGKQRAAARLRALPGPETFDVFVGLPHPINIHGSWDDWKTIRAFSAG